MPSKEGEPRPHPTATQELAPPPPPTPPVEQRERHEDDPLSGISGFGIRVGLGGEFLTTDDIPETKVIPALTEFLNTKGENVDPTPLSKVSTQEREKVTDYEPWRAWMEKWITDAGQENTLLSQRRLAGMKALGVENAKDFATITQEEKDQQIKYLYKRYFEGSTRVKELADSLLQTTTLNGEVSMSGLNGRLEAMDSFLSSCGAESKEAVKQHILMQGVAKADIATKKVFLENAPKNINKPRKNNEPRILEDLQKKYNELHPAKADQQTAQKKPEIKPSPVETAKTQERLSRLLKKEDSVVTLNDKPGVVSLAEMIVLLGQRGSIQFETPHGRRDTLSSADLCFKKGELKGTLQKVKKETDDNGDELETYSHKERVLLLSRGEDEDDFFILGEGHSSLAFINSQEPDGRIRTLLAHIYPGSNPEKNPFTLNDVDETVREFSANKNGGSKRLAELLDEKYGRGFRERLDFCHDDVLSMAPTMGSFSYPIEVKPNTAQARGIAEGRILDQPAEQNHPPEKVLPPSPTPVAQAQENQPSPAKEKRIYTAEAKKLMTELEAQGVTDDEDLRKIILSDIDDILYTFAFPNGVPEKNRSIDIRDVLKNLNKRGMGWDELEKSLFRDAGLDEMVLQVLQAKFNPNTERKVALEEAIKKYQGVINKNSASYQGNRFRAPDAPVTADAFTRELYLEMTEVPPNWLDQPPQNSKPENQAQAEKVNRGKIGFAEKIHPPTRGELEGDLAVSEDNKIIDPEHGLFAVLDGMGGLDAGEYASYLAAKSIGKSKLATLPDTTPIGKVEQVMLEVILEAHQEVCTSENRITGAVKERIKWVVNKDRSEQELKDMFNGLWAYMATTATVAKVLEDGTAVIGSVGDTRAYVLRSNKQGDALEELTLDRGAGDLEKKQEYLAWQKRLSNVEKEEDLEEDWFTFKHRNEVSQALGMNDRESREDKPKDIHPQIETTKLDVGDVLLLTSDGIHDNLTDKEIEACLKKYPNDPQKAADEILAQAYERSQDKAHLRHKADDMTVLVIPRTA